MKSYFLEAVNDELLARQMLSELLPVQSEPWILQTSDHSEVIAYFNVIAGGEEDELTGPYVIMADISGRHYFEDKPVVSILTKLQETLGGIVTDDN